MDTIKEQPLLIPRGTATISPPTEPFDPNEFFQTRSGLWVSSDFRIRILERAEKVGQAPALELAYFDLARPARDSAITAALPQGKPEVALWAIGQMIKAQADGRAGFLCNNGCANLFYLGDSVVRVHWGAHCQGWNVGARPLGGLGWGGGGRAFSCN